jgi:hypothetical protein
MEGLELVMALRKFPTSRLSIYFNTEDTDAASFFCKINGLAEAQVITMRPADRSEEPYVAQWSAIQRQRSQGPLNLVLTAYKRIYQLCSSSHQAVLLYGRVGQVGSLDTEVSWTELSERVRRSREASVESTEGPSVEPD